jgi:type II secretory ATPase GspE/PulE/Tfp pilus assembly ATPase PilB-like protein
MQKKTSDAKTEKEKEKEKETSCFEYLTNIKPDVNNIRELCENGRLRWKIENEGFNTQKNNGYELEHKYCEKSYNGLQNYYTMLQIAHAINQFVEKGKIITEIRKQRPKETITNLWENLRGFFIHSIFTLINMCVELENELENEIEPTPS